MTHNPLTQTCMLVYLSISAWAGRRQDRKATAAVEREFETDRDAGVYSKYLVPPKSLAAVNAAVKRLRDVHYKFTLPWLDGGARVLSAQAYFAYEQALMKEGAEFDKAVDDFVREYPNYCALGQKQQGKLWNPVEYPRDIRRKFARSVQYLPFPSGDDFRVAGLNGHTHAVRQNIDNAAPQVAQSVRVEVHERVREAVERIIDRMTQYRQDSSGKVFNPFRDSLIENARDLVKLLPLLNVTGDAEVTDITSRLDALVRVEPDALRASEALRQKTADEAKAIMDAMAAFV